MGHTTKPRRTVTAPDPVGAAGPLPANRVASVELANDEEVTWTWTSLPGGPRYVSGYTIQKKARRAGPP